MSSVAPLVVPTTNQLTITTQPKLPLADETAACWPAEITEAPPETAAKTRRTSFGSSLTSFVFGEEVMLLPVPSFPGFVLNGFNNLAAAQKNRSMGDPWRNWIELNDTSSTLKIRTRSGIGEEAKTK